MSESAQRRKEMVDRIRDRGVRDPRVLAALAEVPRERFVDRRLAPRAYEMAPLPIEDAQTISEPSMVAIMVEALDLHGRERVLEVGTGSGYGAAVLSQCAGQVLTIEYHQALAHRARDVLAQLGYHNVEVRAGDGTRGAVDRAPFDAISVTAMAQRELPTALVEQLTQDGVLVCPVGQEQTGQLIRWHHGRSETLLPVAFVPLLGGSSES